jgi:hypothetical protein
MLCKLLISAIALGAALTVVIPPAISQPRDRFLDWSRQERADTQRDIRRAQQAGRNYQVYLQNLYNACVNGNQRACQEYRVESQRLQRHRENLIRQEEQYLQNQRRRY